MNLKAKLIGKCGVLGLSAIAVYEGASRAFESVNPTINGQALCYATLAGVGFAVFIGTTGNLVDNYRTPESPLCEK